MKTVLTSHVVCSYLALLGIGLALAGCGSGGPKVVPVSGTVTWNGAPLPEGHIILVPMTPGEIEDSDKIVDGKFAFKARPGSKKVKVMASRPAGPVDPQMGAAPMEQYIPPQYSSAEATVLRAEVSETAPNEYKFELKGP